MAITFALIFIFLTLVSHFALCTSVIKSEASLCNSTDIERGSVGSKVLFREYALAYPQPQFCDMWWSLVFHFSTTLS